MDTPTYIFYGSATGNSQYIAQSLHSSLSLPTPCVELNKWKDTDLTKDAGEGGTGARLFVVCSTTGNGDAPENAGRFVRFVKRKANHTKHPFPNLHYSVLALGDTNYSDFCASGALIDKHLTNCGGERIMNIMKADEATGLEEVVEKWVKDVKTYLTAPPSPTAPLPSPTPLATPSPQGLAPPPPPPTSPGLLLLAKLHPTYTSHTISDEEIGNALMTKITPSNSSLNLSVPTKEQQQLGGLEVVGGSLKSASDSWTHTSSDSATNYTASKPFPSKVAKARYLSGNVLQSLKTSKADIKNLNMEQKMEKLKGMGRRVIELEVTLPDDFSLEYSPGDSLGIIVSNPPYLVHALMERCGYTDEFTSNDGVKRSTKSSLANIDVTRCIKKRHLVGLADAAGDKDERNAMRFMAGKKGTEAFDSFVVKHSVNLFDILRLFPSVKPSINLLISLFTSVPPRYYSVTSSPLYHPHRVKFAFTVVDFEAIEGSGRRLGLATGMMEALTLGMLAGVKGGSEVKLDIFPKHSKEFRLPASSRFPLVLIGPGTGVAPFIGFIEHRKLARQASVETTAESCAGMWRGGFELESGDIGVGRGDTTDFCSSEKAGPIHLFFGCRDENDWIYRQEMEEMKVKGDLTGLHIAFSRKEAGKKVYVQHKMKEETVRKELVNLILKQGAYVFICGDGTRMAHDVTACLTDILGEEQVESLKERKKLVLDIWSG